VNSAYPHDVQVTQLRQAIEIMEKENDPAQKENLQKIIDLLKEHGARETLNTEEPALS
jgi:flagellin-specific chaperone FliS